MRSFIFTTSFIDGGIGCGNYQPRSYTLGRWRRWADYYQQHQALFGAERVFMIDDGSLTDLGDWKATIIEPLEGRLPDELPDGLVIFRFERHLKRTAQYFSQPWLRSYIHSVKIADRYGFDKIINLESDTFVVSQRLAENMKNLAHGWEAMYCPRWTFAEVNAAVVCPDQMATLRTYYQVGEDFWGLNMIPEAEFPFTYINKHYIGDRYSEGPNPPPPDADFISQAPDDFEVRMR